MKCKLTIHWFGTQNSLLFSATAFKSHNIFRTALILFSGSHLTLTLASWMQRSLQIKYCLHQYFELVYILFVFIYPIFQELKVA